MSNNFVSIKMATHPQNVSFARIAIAGFLSCLDPTVDEIADIKTAVSEAVTNAIIHGYDNTDGVVEMAISLEGRTITIKITDTGIGIENVNQVRTPMFTTKPNLERSGLGFTVMEAFMDTVEVESVPGEGTTIVLTKTLGELLQQ